MRIAIIATWFGKLPPYFPMWLKSAEANSDIDFYLFFDQEVQCKSPNIYVVRTTMEKEIKRISETLHEEIQIKNSYKFCDLRPFFGVAYQEYISAYDFWGYCDIDLVFGDIRSFLTDEVLDSYDRFYECGHLSVFRNNEKMNKLYDLPGGIYSKDEIFRSTVKTTPEEQHGLNRICKKNRISWYQKADYADFVVYYSDLQLWHGYKNYEYQIFYWENGHVYRAAIHGDGKIYTNEFVYLHWQKRKPVPDEGAVGASSFFIFSTRLSVKEQGVPDRETIMKMCSVVKDEIHRKEKRKYVRKKLKEFWCAPLKQKLIWLRQKFYYLLEAHSVLEIGK